MFKMSKIETDTRIAVKPKTQKPKPLGVHPSSYKTMMVTATPSILNKKNLFEDRDKWHITFLTFDSSETNIKENKE